MNRYLFLVFAISAFSVFGTGCSTTPTKEIVVQKEYVHVTIPETLLKTYKPTRPATKDVYMSMSDSEKETYLTNYATDLMKLLEMSNTDKRSIRAILEKSKKEAGYESQSKH